MITLRALIETYLTWSAVKPSAPGDYWVRHPRHPDQSVHVVLHKSGAVHSMAGGHLNWYDNDQTVREWEWMPVIDPKAAESLRRGLEALEDDGK